MELKKKEQEGKNSKGKKKEERKVNEKKKTKVEKKIEEKVDDKPLMEIKEKLDKIDENINVLNNNKNIGLDKKNKLQQFLLMYTNKYKEITDIKIDLVDSKGEKININSKGDLYANEYLIEKTVYELNSYNIPQKSEEDNKDSKKATKKEEKKKETKENKEEQKEIELVLEPVKIDGYCFRTIKEEQNITENEKTGTKDKKVSKKK